MSLQHFFLENQVIADCIDGSLGDASCSYAQFKLGLSREDLRHASALRLRAGEHIGVIDSAGVYYECEVSAFDGRELYVRVCEHYGDVRGSVNAVDFAARQSEITLAFGLMKGTKADDVVRACTEIGVSAFLPVEFERCVSRPDAKSCAKKVARWLSIAKSAAMQSGQFRVPSVEAVSDFGGFCSALSGFDQVVVFWEEADLSSRYVMLPEQNLQKIAVVVGPEGGITAQEIEAIKKANKNSQIVSMGRSILRAQTACTLACGIVKYENDKISE